MATTYSPYLACYRRVRRHAGKALTSPRVTMPWLEPSPVGARADYRRCGRTLVLLRTYLPFVPLALKVTRSSNLIIRRHRDSRLYTEVFTSRGYICTSSGSLPKARDRGNIKTSLLTGLMPERGHIALAACGQCRKSKTKVIYLRMLSTLSSVANKF